MTSRVEMMEQMFKLQLEEDRKVQEAHGVDYQQILYEDRYYFALLDEFGELNHELKPYWCWWKNTVGRVDWEAVKEEFSDVTHFIFSFCLARSRGRQDENFLNLEEPYFKDVDYSYTAPELLRPRISRIIQDITDYVAFKESDIYSDQMLIRYWFRLSQMLQLDFEKDVYEPYIRKNAVNQQRVADGY